MKAVWVGCALALTARLAAADEPPPTPEPTPAPETPTEETTETPPPPGDHEMRDKPSLKPAFSRREIVVDVPGERKRQTVYLLAGLAAGGAVFGAVGLYFHLDSRSASDEVSAQKFTGRAWTQANQDLVDGAARSRTRAAIFYGVGTALVSAAIVGLIVTDPSSERRVIRPHTSSTNSASLRDAARPSKLGLAVGIAPLPGGAMVGGGWSW